MSAANFMQAELPDGKTREPSMEEILASIRRIIAQDQALFAAEDASRPDLGSSQGTGSDAADDVDAEALAYIPEAAGQRGAAQSEGTPRANGRNGAAEPLVSTKTDETVAKAFETLVASRFAQNSDAILAMTHAALRPLLEAWLDAHLPALVERLVRAEIERMAKGV